MRSNWPNSTSRCPIEIQLTKQVSLAHFVLKLLFLSNRLFYLMMTCFYSANNRESVGIAPLRPPYPLQSNAAGRFDHSMVTDDIV